MSDSEMAPGAPGGTPAWASSDKDGVATGLGNSNVWITIGRGILNEIYWPRLDSPQIRDLGFIVADDAGYWDEVKRGSTYDLNVPSPGIPAYQAVHHGDRYTLTLDFLPDPGRDVVLIKAHLDGDEALKLYPLLAPHLGNTGSDNTAWVERFRNWNTLFAQRERNCLALCVAGPDSESAVSRASAGYVGVSDGWQDFNRHDRMTATYKRAEHGNVALMAEVPSHDCLLALGFGDTPELAATTALASLHLPFDTIRDRYLESWRLWQSSCRIPASMDIDVHNVARISATVLKTHVGRIIPGAMVASLSIPWGQSHDDIGGYHLIWSRDLVESAGGLLAFGAAGDARLVLSYLIASQQEDGHWAQNQWLDGRPYWSGIQMDEVGFPILLAQALDEHDELADMPVKPMIERAAVYLAQNGPVTQQDRWEEDPGLSPFTLAVEVAALVSAARFLDEPARSYALELADYWNSRIEDWTYTTSGNLAKEHGLGNVDGYYVRIAPPEAIDGEDAANAVVAVKNRPPSSASGKTSEFVSLEFLELVRLGLRRAADPKIVNTVKLIDAMLRVDTPSGAAWHRYNDDGYGEHEDGSPFDGTGIGRAWPLLAGERGHYALSAGDDPEPYLQAMTRMTSKGGMIPEQIWDTADIPERHLFFGRPSGSAMPLVWAHAEFLKLTASALRGTPVDRPQPVWERYQGLRPDVAWAAWRFNQRVRTIPAGKQLRIEVLAPAVVHWSTDGWTTTHDSNTRDTGLGVYLVDLPVETVASGDTIAFTFFWPEVGHWENENFSVVVHAAE